MSTDDVPPSAWNAATNNDGSNTPPAEMPGITPPKRGRNAIDETSEVKLAPPHPLPLAPTPKDVSPPWHTIATFPHRHIATHAFPRKSTPSRMAVRTAHRLEASGSRSRVAVTCKPPQPKLCHWQQHTAHTETATHGQRLPRVVGTHHTGVWYL